MSNSELLERLERHACERPDRPAYAFLGEGAAGSAVSWRALHRAVCAWAGRFAARVEAGQTLLINSPNCPEVVVAALAGFAAGLRVFLASAELPEVELASQLEQAGAVAAVAGGRCAASIQQKLAIFWAVEELAPRRIPDTANADLPSRPGGDLILQSSGTTGFPRLVLRRGRAIDAVCGAMVQSIGFSPEDRVLAMLPLSHSYGLEHGLLAPVWAGSTVLLGRGLDVHAMTRELADGATIFPTVPSVVEVLADLPGPVCAMPSLRRVYSAGGPLPRSVFDRFHRRYQRRISQLYGATEVGSVTFNSGEDPYFDPGSVGQPMNGVTIHIVDQDDPNRILRSGEEGQVVVRADSMFDGYVGEEPPFIRGGFPTGDLGTLDRWGRLTITGRLKLLIDVGGVKVNPAEVEAVIREHPDVSLCVVVPVRQSETVYRLRAIATPRDPANPPSVEALRRLVRQRLAAYKVPRTIEIRDSLPTTLTGKVLRHLVEAT